MLLLEILDTEVAFKVVKNDDDYIETTAIINGRTITFNAYTFSYLESKGKKVAPSLKARIKHRDKLKDKTSSWNMVFYETKPDKNGKLVNTIQKTGSGGELAVFAFIKKSCDILMKKSPRYVIFSALKSDDDQNRVTLYTRLVNRFANNFYIKKDEDGNTVDFELQRKHEDK